jgi:hypothetical protein
MEPRSSAFSAEYEIRVATTGGDGVRRESRTIFRLYRDGRGRTRLEGETPAGEGAPLRFAFLTDGPRHHGVVVDLDSGRSLEPARWPPLGFLWNGEGRPGGAAGVLLGQRTEDLGLGEIEGLAARGFRTTTAFSVVDVWTALRIDQPPLLVRRQEREREETQRLFNVRIGEPDAALFVELDARTITAR